MLDFLEEEKLRAHVIEQLTQVGGRVKGDDIIILCPFHVDRTPSLRININPKKPSGIYHCFACNAHGPFNKLADALRLEKFIWAGSKVNSVVEVKDNKTETKFSEIEDLFSVLHKVLTTTPILTKEKPRELIGIEQLPPNFKWRGYGYNFYKSLGGMFYWDQKKDADYLYLPLTMNKNYVGYTICSLTKGIIPKYEIYADTSKTFLLYDYVPSNTSIVLVEGHFDALRLYAEGIHALAIFGTSNWSTIKKNYLLAKNPKKVLILMDGDEAGYKASEHIFMDLRNCCEVDIFYLPKKEDGSKGFDPGDMPEYYIEEVRNKL